MKIRTFLACENFAVNEEDNNVFTIHKMLKGLTLAHLPKKESIVMMLVFDDVEEKPKRLEVVLLDAHEKPIKNWVAELHAKQVIWASRLEADFKEQGKHSFKIAYNGGEFLGKYPFYIEKGGEDNES